MRVIRKYWRQMSPRRHAYCYCVLELMERGYKYRDAKKMVVESGYLDYAENHPSIFFHYAKEDWADWIINAVASSGKLRYIG
ncbi:MAG: hypothetical protein IKG61_02850 [Selenomonadaceae bacterium]|nr:hypothetical protein [Selenomonadaceae bacterium]MBR3050374.1 hypothetical protein [Selenomonadaceae bacterium]